MRIYWGICEHQLSIGYFLWRNIKLSTESGILFSIHLICLRFWFCKFYKGLFNWNFLLSSSFFFVVVVINFFLSLYSPTMIPISACRLPIIDYSVKVKCVSSRISRCLQNVRTFSSISTILSSIWHRLKTLWIDVLSYCKGTIGIF